MDAHVRAQSFASSIRTHRGRMVALAAVALVGLAVSAVFVASVVFLYRNLTIDGPPDLPSFAQPADSSALTREILACSATEDAGHRQRFVFGTQQPFTETVQQLIPELSRHGWSILSASGRTLDARSSDERTTLRYRGGTPSQIYFSDARISPEEQAFPLLVQVRLDDCHR